VAVRSSHRRGASTQGDRTLTAYGVSLEGGLTPHHVRGDDHWKKGIRVNRSSPASIITDARPVRNLDEKMLAGLSKATLTPNVCQPEDIADCSCSWPQTSPATARDRSCSVRRRDVGSTVGLGDG